MTTSPNIDLDAKVAELTSHLADGPLRPDRPRVEVTNEVLGYDSLVQAMTSPSVPKLYVRSGGLNWITEGDRGEPRIHRLNQDNLLAWFADHVETYRVKEVGKGENKEQVQVPCFPSGRTCAAILGRKEWPLPRLHGVVTAPVVRPDGSLLQTIGFDNETGLFLFPKIRNLGPISPYPTMAEVHEASRLLRYMLNGFPWVDPQADLANYLGLAFTPLLRHYAPGPTPMGMITATTMGSGKSYLAYLFDALYGMGTATLKTDTSDELRKLITTKLTQTGAPVITFDNVDNGAVLKSPVLAQLLTSDYWEDRLLGSTTNVGAPNDRLWLVTGNNIRTGGDMSRRVVWVRLDPDCPAPDQRTFEMGDFRIWLSQHAEEVLRAMLTIVSGWLAAGRPGEADARKSNTFGLWEGVTAALLKWAGFDGFLNDRVKNRRVLDEEESEWYTFLSVWHEIWGDKPVSSKDVLLSPDVAEHVPLTNRHERPVPRQLGQWFAARMGRYYGGEYRLVEREGPKNAGKLWSVTRLNA